MTDAARNFVARYVGTLRSAQSLIRNELKRRRSVIDVNYLGKD
jgi:hypothetical protein